MRAFIAVTPKPYSLGGDRPEIESVIVSFGRYLDSYRTKTTRSKHGLLGPVGKVIQEIKSRKWQPEALAGYALNIHRANQGYISPEATEALVQAIKGLMALYDKVPTSFRDRLLDQVDYGLYYVRRKKLSDYFEERNKAFCTFLAGRYPSVSELVTAWEEKTEKIGSFEHLSFSKAEMAKAKGKKREDFEAFHQFFRERVKVSELALVDETEEED
jgi:hypothetical protein